MGNKSILKKLLKTAALPLLATAALCLPVNLQADLGLMEEAAAYNYGSNDVVRATMTGGALVEIPYGTYYDTSKMPEFSFKESGFTQEKIWSGYQRWDPDNSTWVKVQNGEPFQMLTKYRYVAFIDPGAGNTIDKGMHLIVDETGDFFNGYDRGDEWSQDPGNANTFISPEIISVHSDPWTNMGPTFTSVNAADAIPDQHFRNILVKNGYLASANGKLDRETALSVTSLYLPDTLQGYSTHFGTSGLSGIQYFPNLRELDVDLGNNSNVKSLYLQNNLKLWSINISNMACTGELDFPSVTRKLTLSGGVFTNLYDEERCNLKSLKQLYYFAYPESKLTYTVSFEKNPKLAYVNLTGSAKIEKVKTAADARIVSLEVENCSSLEKLELTGAQS